MNRAANQYKQQGGAGFTLIELMLAMTFISILLLAIAMTIIQIGTIYNKGLVLKEINQVGRAVADDVKRTTAASESMNLSTDYVPHTAGGRLCLGTYSYIWNTARALEQSDVNITTYAVADKPTIRFVKVPDSAKMYCAKTPAGALTHRSISVLDTDKTQELLPSGDHSLGINQFQLIPSAVVTDTSTGGSLYTLEYTLGTGKISAMNPTQTACLGPGELNSDLTYCSVVQFSIVLRAGNKVN